MCTRVVIKVHNINFRENPSVVLRFLSTERDAEVYRCGEVNENGKCLLSTTFYLKAVLAFL
jgi:hypothetical protein